MKSYKLKIKGKSYEVNVNDLIDNSVKVEVNGVTYDVEIEHSPKSTKTPTLLRTPVPQEPAQSKVIKKAYSGGFLVKAPLPGTVLKVLVKEGDKVNKGDKMIVMEAMKMENNITAERDGVIKSIKVSPGTTVLQNDDLLEIG